MKRVYIQITLSAQLRPGGPQRSCRRPGRPGPSKACGALVGALGDIKGSGLAPSCSTPGGEIITRCRPPQLDDLS